MIFAGKGFQTAVAKLYGVSAIPTTYLLHEKGRIHPMHQAVGSLVTNSYPCAEPVGLDRPVSAAASLSEDYPVPRASAASCDPRDSGHGRSQGPADCQCEPPGRRAGEYTIESASAKLLSTTGCSTGRVSLPRGDLTATIRAFNGVSSSSLQIARYPSGWAIRAWLT